MGIVASLKERAVAESLNKLLAEGRLPPDDPRVSEFMSLHKDFKYESNVRAVAFTTIAAGFAFYTYKTRFRKATQWEMAIGGSALGAMVFLMVERVSERERQLLVQLGRENLPLLVQNNKAIEPVYQEVLGGGEQQSAGEGNSQIKVDDTPAETRNSPYLFYPSKPSNSRDS